MLRGIRGKLLLASVAVILAIGLPAALLIRAAVTETIEARVEEELRDHVRAARVALLAAPDLDDATADQVVERLARDTGLQVDLLGFDHRMIASSSDAGVAGDVLDRPEVKAAIERGSGFARRAHRAFYAVRMVAPDQRGLVVRASRAVDELDAAYRRLYRLFAIATVIGLVVAAGMTMLASQILSREVRRLAEGARDIARGRTRRITVDPSGAIGVLGGSLNQMAEGVERTVAALAEERALLESVLDGIRQGIVALDGERRITMMNEAARQILDLPQAPIGDVLIDHVRIPAIVSLLDAREPGATELQTPRGTRVVARIVRMRAGRGAILMLEDVTTVRRLETIRQDFVANLSHELRTPVSIIRANAETLNAGAKDDPAMATRLVDGLHRNAERLARILADLLDLSRLDAGQYRFESTSVDVRAAADQAIATLEQAAASRGVAISVAIAPELRVRADAKALDQVLVNLIDNAIKYGGGQVWIDGQARGERVRVEVRDDGPGIAPRHRVRIFERFYRVDPGRSREMGGTGLGLSIVKHLVESMGGQIGVEPNAPKGTTFWLELPTARDR